MRACGRCDIFTGVPSPVRNPERMNVVIFRENTEDVYAGIEWRSGTPEAKKLIDFLNNEMLKGEKKQMREDSGVGIKPISPTGTKRLVRRAIQYALEHKRKRGDAGAQGQHHEVHRRRVPRLGLRTGREEFRDADRDRARELDSGQQGQESESDVEQNAAMIEPGLEQATGAVPKDDLRRSEDRRSTRSGARTGTGQWKQKILVNDRIADSVFQQILTRADEYQVFATPNLNGDYLSDACAAQVGGLGMAPGANIGDGYGVFEATHGTAPKYADKDVINPSSVMLCGRDDVRVSWDGRKRRELIEDGIARDHSAEARDLRPGTA